LVCRCPTSLPYPNPKHTTHNAEGVRPARKNHPELPPAAFTMFKTLDEVDAPLFGEMTPG
jgi:hypothetical protein